MLELNPKNRISVKEALSHDYFKSEPLMSTKDTFPKFYIDSHELQVRNQRKPYQGNFQNNHIWNNNQNNNINNNNIKSNFNNNYINHHNKGNNYYKVPYNANNNFNYHKNHIAFIGNNNYNYYNQYKSSISHENSNMKEYFEKNQREQPKIIVRKRFGSNINQEAKEQKIQNANIQLNLNTTSEENEVKNSYNISNNNNNLVVEKNNENQEISLLGNKRGSSLEKLN